MTTTPSIDLSLPELPVAGQPAPVAAPTGKAPALPGKAAPQPAIDQFQAALAHPFAENAALQQALEEVVRQIAQSPMPQVAVAPAPQTPVSSTMPQVEASYVDATSCRVVDSQPVVAVQVPETVTRQDVASTISVLPTVPQVEVPYVDATSCRVVDSQPVVADEAELADAVVAAGVRMAEPVVPVSVAAVETAAPVTGVEAVKAAFAPAAVPATETFLEAANAVADVLLVTPGLLRGEGEIRVQLRPDVLEGAEVRIAVTGRQLDIAFIPRTTDVAELIEQNRPQLEQHLAARFHTFRLSVGVQRRAVAGEKGRSA